jgi:hypothetical protein
MNMCSMRWKNVVVMRDVEQCFRSIHLKGLATHTHMVDVQLPEKALTLLSFGYFTTNCTVLFTLVYLLLSSQVVENKYVFY